MQGLSDAAASGPRVAMSGLGAWPHGGSVLPGPQTNSSSRRSCTCDSTFSRACVQDDRGSRGSPPRARSTYRVSLILSGAEQVRIQPATASAAPELASRTLTCRAVLLPRAVGIRHPAFHVCINKKQLVNVSNQFFNSFDAWQRASEQTAPALRSRRRLGRRMRWRRCGRRWRGLRRGWRRRGRRRG